MSTFSAILDPMQTPDSLSVPTPVASSLSAEQDATWSVYQRMRLRLAEHLNRELAHQTGLSEADYEILSFLAEAPHTPIRAIALRCGLQWEKSRLSHQLRRMEERGLIRRELCPTDNRSFEVVITEMGRGKAVAAQAIHTRLVERHVFAALTPAQTEMFRAIADAVLSTLTDEMPHQP